MSPLHQMSFEEFGRLRFLDFFPKTEFYSDDSDGGLECGIGLAASEGYGHTYFARPLKSKVTAEIALDFKNRCPEAEGNALLAQLGLPLRKGMTGAQVREALGVAKEQKLWTIVVGHRWPYYLGCVVFAEGLERVWICRKDLADEWDAFMDRV
jgi:hypothetical protein